MRISQRPLMSNQNLHHLCNTHNKQEGTLPVQECVEDVVTAWFAIALAIWLVMPATAQAVAMAWIAVDCLKIVTNAIANAKVCICKTHVSWKFWAFTRSRDRSF